jgi:glutamate/tyrosine decarboxylase-like PLP-dependent enzyme
VIEPQLPGWQWDEGRFRELMDQAAAICSDILRDAAHGPVTRAMPGGLVKELATTPAPLAGMDASLVLVDVAEKIAPYPFGNGHPRFFAWVNSPPHPVGVAAAAVAAALNPSVAGGRHSAVHIEHEVIRWFLDLLGWSRPASHGLLTSGGSAATLTALSAARHRAYARAGLDDRLDGTAGARPVVYATSAAHSCIVKGVEALGLGSRNIRTVPVDEKDRLRPQDLEAMLVEDQESGRLPVAVIASVGTVNTGAMDPVGEIASICEEHGTWLHVDGAYGGPAVLLLPELTDVRDQLSHVDSIALDPHKWLYTPVDVGVVMFRDAQIVRDTFSLVPPYLQTQPSPDEPVWLSEYGLEQTRPFRALKLWAQLRHIGLDGYRNLIGRDIEVARALRDALDAAPDFEVLAHGLSIVCFRHRPSDIPDSSLDEHHRRLAAGLQTGGEAFIAPTTVDSVTALRACVVNPHTTVTDAIALLDIIRVQARRPTS